MGADDFDATTAVSLVSFEAVPGDSSVELRWETANERDNAGFHLYRSLSAAGPWERITASLIPGLGSSPEGARYSYRDLGLENGVTVHYLRGRNERSARPAGNKVVLTSPGEGLRNGRISDRLSGGDMLGMSRAAEELIETVKGQYGVTIELYRANELIKELTNGHKVEIYVRGQLTDSTAGAGSLAAVSGQLRMAEVDLETRTLMMQEALQRILAAPKVSRDLFEIASKSLETV